MRGEWRIKQFIRKLSADEKKARWLRARLLHFYKRLRRPWRLGELQRRQIRQSIKIAIYHTMARTLQTDYSCPLPTGYLIDPGNVCNLRCPFCPTGLRQAGLKKGLLSLENYQIIFDKISPYATTLALFNWGEPLLNKDIIPMISISAKNGIHTEISSNLAVSYMGDKEADALVQSGLAVLSASIDGASQATYERYRVGGSFDLALGNLERLQRAKDRGNISTLKLKWTFLINKFNEHELEIAKRRAADIGVEIIFSLMDMGDDLSWKSSFHPHPVRSAEATQESGPRVSVLPCSIDSIQLHPQLYGWCMNPFNLMVINWDGNVLPCCNAFGDEFSLGNLLSEDVETIWNGIKLCNCRRFIHHYGPPQNTVSLCEILPCPVRKKAIS